MTFTVYTIHSGNHCYVGYTNDMMRRLRQHRGELKGGARATRVAKDWQYLMTISSEAWTARCAMRAEYKVKHPDGKRRRPARYSGVRGRIASLGEICHRLEGELTVSVRHDLLHLVPALPENVTLQSLPESLLRECTGTDSSSPLATTC